MIHPVTLRWFVSGAILLATTASGYAAPTDTPSVTTPVRSGDHPDFGRLVFDTIDAQTYHLDRVGDRVIVRFDPDVTLGRPPSAPRNVLSIRTAGSSIDLTLNRGAQVHTMRIDGRLILDVLDPKSDPDAPASSPEADKRPTPQKPVPTMALSPELGGRSFPRAPDVATPAEHAPVKAQPLSPPTETAAHSAPEPAVPEATRQILPGRDILPENEGPVGLIARRVKLPKEMDGTAFLVPFDTTTGAASFHGLDSTYIVFDERRPVDMAALRSDPIFGAASVRLLPNGTLLRIPLPQGLSIALTQIPRGWRIAALTATPKQQPIAAALVDGRLGLAAEQSGNIVHLADPDTGATLLVGTQHRPGQGVATTRRSTEFILRPTIQGVVVEPLSDAIELTQVQTGFTLSGNPGGLALSSAISVTETLMDSASLTRRLNFSTMRPEAVMQRALMQLKEAAAAPQLARGLKHHAAAESLMALGLAAEAESLLRMAAEQDPREAASPDTAALTAIAALLAGRTTEADALLDPRLDGTDEIALWRAVRLATLDEGSPGAAAVFAATAPLASQYPAPIRDRILPLMVETMIQGGELGPAARLLAQRKNDPKLSYAQALMRQAEGETDQALGMLDALANGHDQFDRARAAIRAVELRLATRELDKAQAADALDKLLYAWRGDARELTLRERVADLRGQTGAWHAALETLRQAETDFPEQAVLVHGRLKDTFAAMIRDQGAVRIPPIEFVSMVDENTDLMPPSGGDEELEQSLADRLLALDLNDRAKPVLEKLLRSAQADVPKARFGFGLATLKSREGDDAGVQQVLDASEGHDLPPDLVEQRTILRAGSVARLGDPSAGAAMLAPLRTLRATEARAQVWENALDWPQAAQAWTDVAALTLPESGMLDDAQSRTVLRLATATARSGDDAGLADLRAKYGARIGSGPLADMFRLLTAEPIRTTADMGRSKREMSLAASVPAGLRAMQSGTATR
jgi:tetratricopeptide (TPR) repeat protein